MASYSPSMPAPALTDGKTSRLFSLDVLRGVSILGILVISIWAFGGFTTNQQTFYRTGTHGGNYKLLAAVSILFEGKMRALLSIVFGAGIILFMSKKTDTTNLSAPDLYIRRNLWLLLFGILNAVVLLWPGDILFHYAVLGILLFPFWRLSARGLFAGAILLTLIYSAKSYWNYADDQKAYGKYMAVTAVEKKFASADTLTGQRIDSLLKLQNINPLSSTLANDSLLQRHKNDTLTQQQTQDKSAWEGMAKRLKYDSTADDGENKAMRTTSYTKTWNHLLGRTQNHESYWLYRTGIWDIGSMMLLGMALLGFGFFGRLPVKKHLFIAIPCILAGLALAWWRNSLLDARLADYAKYIDKHAIPYDLFFPFERLLLAVGYASMIMALLRLRFLDWFWRTLAAAGKMAFTNYFLQTIICTFFFYGYGMGFFGRFSQWQLYFIALEIWLFQLVFSVIWLRFFTMGPVEWLWRWLTCGKKMPFRQRGDEPTILKPVPSN